MLQRDLAAGNYTLAMLQRGLLIKAAQNAVTAVTTTTTTTTTTKAAGRKKREEEGNVAISNTVVFANAMSFTFYVVVFFQKMYTRTGLPTYYMARLEKAEIVHDYRPR